MSTLIFLAHLSIVGQLAPAAAAAEPAPTGSTAPAPAPTEPTAETPAPAAEPTEPAAEPDAPVAPASEPAAAPAAEAPAAAAATPAAEPVYPPAKKSRARDKGQFSFFWDMSQTVGSSHRFVDDFSLRGFSVAFTYRVLPILGVGVLSGTTYTDDVVRATRKTENAALTATELRTIETVPIMATATVYIPTGRKGTRGIAEPYVGLGIGTSYTYRRADAGWVYGSQDGWHFGLMPMLGVQINTPGPQVILGSRFNWAAKTDNSPQELLMTFNVGLGFFAF